MIIRALGPSLPVDRKLADPILELYDASGGLITTNDNWPDAANKQAIIDTGIAPTSDLESVILTTLPANNSAYTTVVRGVNGGTGVGLVEIYDLDTSGGSRLANISTRGVVQTGADVMIGGFIVLGSSQSVIVRAIGPSLPVDGKLADPTLELHDQDGALLQFNDDWMTDQPAQITATGVPPSDSHESAIVTNLAPGITQRWCAARTRPPGLRSSKFTR